MAYASNESGRYELYVQSFPDPGPRVQVSTGGLATAIWWRKPNEILYLDRNLSSMMAVAIEIGETIKIGATRDLFKLAGGVIEISAAPDGERFLATMIIPGRAQSAMSVVVNWDAEIRNR
jgi:hypothetical protein